jgi:hypothetical protein
MLDDQSIDIPPSFLALYLSAGRVKPSDTRAVIGARYELCEDLATLLVEHAKSTLFDLGITEDDVLLRCQQGLLGDASVVSPQEAQWVIRRLAELLGWDAPDPSLTT